MHGALTIAHQLLMLVCSINAAGLNWSKAPGSSRQYPAILISNSADWGFRKGNDNYDLVRGCDTGKVGTLLDNLTSL